MFRVVVLTVLAAIGCGRAGFAISSDADVDASGGTSLGLVGHWQFDEGTGTTTADGSAGDHDGLLVNGPAWTTGKLGGALHFTALDGAVSTVLIGTTFDVPSLPLTIARPG